MLTANLEKVLQPMDPDKINTRLRQCPRLPSLNSINSASRYATSRHYGAHKNFYCIGRYTICCTWHWGSATISKRIQGCFIIYII